MAAPVVFFDIAGPDDQKIKDFYSAAFDWSFDPQGQVAVGVVSPLAGAVRKDPAEKRLYIGVPDVEAALEAIQAHGGSVDASRFEVPGVVVLGLFKDPAGNEMGLVEMDGDKPKIP
ncbi:MAG: hypothetical protein GVY32_11260 [Gammaproteobacteria bacterium]|jgi:predicted enzyme related to lactoylglutathione lyase|nr:hypothetical protein [Gammaproteobacteria bacterium]